MAVALAVFCVTEAAIFRSGFYSNYLEPGSSAGVVVAYLRNEANRRGAGRDQVLAIGDSRMGLKARVANELTSRTGYTFATIATPGSSPRVWYYMLREADPERTRYGAILIGVEDYEDEDWEDYANRTLDIN